MTSSTSRLQCLTTCSYSVPRCPLSNSPNLGLPSYRGTPDQALQYLDKAELIHAAAALQNFPKTLQSYSTICGFVGSIWKENELNRPHASPPRGKYRIISARRGWTCELAKQQGMRSPFYVRCLAYLEGCEVLFVTGPAQHPPAGAFQLMCRSPRRAAGVDCMATICENGPPFWRPSFRVTPVGTLQYYD
jgi:hypothetical protein